MPSKLKSKGFGLLGMLAVVAILGIMAAIAIPAVSRYMSKSAVDNTTNTQPIEQQAGTNELELKTLQLAEAAYMFDHNGTALTGIISGGGSDLAKYLYNKPLQGTYLVTQDADTKDISITPLSSPSPT